MAERNGLNLDFMEFLYTMLNDMSIESRKKDRFRKS
jgi:hypothetical protein